MADFHVIGYINAIKYLPDGCLVFIDEIKAGFKRKDGTSVDDKILQWKCIFNAYFKKFINEHFSENMLVQIKGEITPFAVSHDEIIDGYSVLGQCINRASYPKLSTRREVKQIKDSIMHDIGTPNVDEYMRQDF